MNPSEETTTKDFNDEKGENLQGHAHFFGRDLDHFFFSPELAIRRYVLFQFQPVQSLTLQIEDKGVFDPQYGYLFDVSGYRDPLTKDELSVFYLKKYGIFWMVADVGSGP